MNSRSEDTIRLIAVGTIRLQRIRRNTVSAPLYLCEGAAVYLYLVYWTSSPGFSRSYVITSSKCEFLKFET